MPQLDTRQRYSLSQMIDNARRTTRDNSIITLCDQLDRDLTTFNPDFCQRQGIPLATTLPDLTAARLANARSVTHEEHTVALVERLLKLFPPGQTLPDKPPPDKPDKPDKLPETPDKPPAEFVQEDPRPKQATPSGGRPRTVNPSAEAYRKRKARERKKAELEQVLKGQERKK